MPPASPVPPVTGDVKLWQADALGPVPHGFTDRHGGLSDGPCASLSLKLAEASGRAAVRANRQRVLDALGCSERAFVTVKQVHGDAVVEVTRGASPHIEADGIWTRDKQVVLAILTADCVPILLMDKKRRAVAAVHAGWRGTESRIAARMIERLRSVAGILPTDVVAVLGPSIGPCCFEIGKDTAVQLRTAYPEAGEYVRARGSQKCTANLWALNRMALIDAGMNAADVSALSVCTVCTSSFFSYRRDRGVTGRQAGVIGL